MAYSLRGLFGMSAIVAVFMAAIYSRSDLAVLLSALFFVILILLGTAMAFVATSSRNFWRGFAVVAIGTVLLSPQVELFEVLSHLINAKVRPPIFVYSMPSTYSPTSPTPTWTIPTYTAPVVSASGDPTSGTTSSTTVTIPPYSGSTSVLLPQPVSIMTAGSYSMGSGIDLQLQKLLVVATALILGVIGGVIIDMVMLRAERRSEPKGVSPGSRDLPAGHEWPGPEMPNPAEPSRAE